MTTGELTELYGVASFSPSSELDYSSAIVVVSSDKAANAAIRLLPRYSIFAWSRASGASSVDLALLANKKIILWPDAGVQGLNVMIAIGRNLQKAGATQIYVVFTGLDMPSGWNISNMPVPADGMDEDSREVLLNMAQDMLDKAVPLKLIEDLSAAVQPAPVLKVTDNPLDVAHKIKNFLSGKSACPPEFEAVERELKKAKSAQMLAKVIRSLNAYQYQKESLLVEALETVGYQPKLMDQIPPPEPKNSRQVSRQEREQREREELDAKLTRLHEDRGDSSAHKLACSILEKYDRPSRVGAAEQSHILLNLMEEKSCTTMEDLKVTELQPGGFGKNSIFDWVRVNEQDGTYQVVEPLALASQLKAEANEYLLSYGMSPKFSPNTLSTLLPMAAYKYDRIKTRSFGFYREDGKYDHYVKHRIGFSETARKAAKDKPDGINAGSLKQWVARYCPHWGEFLSRNSKPLTFMSWVGAVFDEDVRHLQQAFFLKGDGNDGKSSVATIIGEALGEACFHGMWDSGRFNSHLHNKRMYVVQELNKTDITSDSLFKLATGDKRISLERKGVDKIQVDNEVHLLICTNNDLQIGNQRAERRRVLLSCVRSFNGVVDRSISEHLRNELDCFLIACRWAWDTFNVNKTLVPLDLEGEQFTAEQDKDSTAWDEFRDWFEVRFEFKPGVRIKKQRLTESLTRDNKNQTFQRKLREWLIKQGCREERDEQSRYWVGFAETSGIHVT
jgi:hypothetical protein